MSNYWATRFIEEEQRIYELTEKEIERQLLEYEKAISSINKEIEIWYNRIAKNNEVSFIEAKQLLNKKELKELKWTLEEYVKYAKKNGLGNKWTKELNNASSRIHIERLEALKLQTNAQIEKLYNIRDKRTENHLKNIYTEHYKKSSEAILKTGLVGGKKTKFDEKLVDKVIKKPWAPDGKHFSDRLWNDKEKLLNVLHIELTQGFIRGDKLDTLINSISKKLNASKSNVARLVHTESSAYSSRARYESFKDVGVEKYEIVAALDNRTSDICRSMDSKVFDIKEYEIGITAPPFHVRCRTTTVPYFDDDKDEERAARNTETGKTEYVPASMKYKEWEEKYIKKEKNPTVEMSGNVEKVSNGNKETLEKVEKEKIKTLEELSNDWYEKLTEEEKGVIFRYSTGDNMDVSSYTRGLYKTNFPEEIKYYEKLVNSMDNALYKFELDRDIKVYRSVQGNFYRQFGLNENDVYTLDKFRIGNEENIVNYKEMFGKEFIDKGYVSTSLNINEPFRLNGEDTHTLFEINVKKGTKGAYLGKNSAIVSQEEFLLSRNTKFKIKELEIKDVNYIDDYGQEISQKVLVVKVDTMPEKTLKKIKKENIIKPIIENKPKTLENHKEYLEKWYSNKLRGLIPEEDERTVSRILKDVIDKSDFAMRYKIKYIDDLIESGRFKNTFETSTSGGAMGTMFKKYRKQAPINLFGVSEKLKKIDYEKYGYITSKNYLEEYNSKMSETLKMYGDAIIKFNKEKLKNKVTFTVDDSLANAVIEKVVAPSVDNPSIHSMDKTKIKYYTNILKENKAKNVIELTNNLGVRYLETQYHGEVLLSDVSSICFTDKIPNENSIKKLKKIGIKLYRIEGGNVVEI